MNFLLLSSFYILLYFHGRGIFKILNYFHLNKESNYKISLFYPIFSFFYIGNLAVLFNFFKGINNTLFFIVVLIPFFFNFLKLEFNINKNIFNYFFYNFITIFFLSSSTQGVGLHKDASLYHLAYQNWIREVQINGGLINLHGRFGYSSLYDYFSSVFWLRENFILLHFVNLSFIIFFSNFLFFILIERKSHLKNLYFCGLFILGFSILDNFGINGGRNGYIYIEGIGKQDTAFGIVFFVGSILLLDSFHRKSSKSTDILILFVLSILAFQIRITGSLLLLLFVLFIFLKVTNKLTIILSISIFSIFWFIKNLIISSCLYYPLLQSCTNLLPWSNLKIVKEDSNSISVFHVALKSHESFMHWFSHWITSELNRTIFYNFIFSILLISIFLIIFTKIKKIEAFDIILFLYTLIFIILWIYQAPDFRLGIGFTLLLPGLLGYLVNNLKFGFEKILTKTIVYILLIFSFFLLPRIEQHKSNFENLTVLTLVSEKQINYIENIDSWGSHPENGEDCGLRRDCSPYISNLQINIGKYFTYLFIDEQ